MNTIVYYNISKLIYLLKYMVSNYGNNFPTNCCNEQINLVFNNKKTEKSWISKDGENADTKINPHLKGLY